MKHSKLPWKIRHGEFPVGTDATIIAQASSNRCICKIHMHNHEYSKGNAEFIVKSVNNHQKLVDFAETALFHGNRHPDDANWILLRNRAKALLEEVAE